MTDLAEFLLARIAEDEAAAKAAAPAPWSYGDIDSVAGGSLYDPGVMIASIHWDNDGERPEPIHRFRSEEQADATGEHIVRWDPARILDECDMKRRIWAHEMAREQSIYGTTANADANYVLRCLALSYADHPDYRQEWRP